MSLCKSLLSHNSSKELLPVRTLNFKLDSSMLGHQVSLWHAETTE